MIDTAQDARWMGAALALSLRGRGQTAPNPAVGCVIVKDSRMIGRGWTQPTGRPHAEAVALAQAGDAAQGSTAYVTLEPCAHESVRGPNCASGLIDAGVTRVVAAIEDPDPRTGGRGFDWLRAAGIAVDVGTGAADAVRTMAGFLMRQRKARAYVTLKLATSLDGCIAMASGESRWITGDAARAHGHMLRAQSDAILVGRGTWDADAPALDVRLPGLEHRSPKRLVLTSRPDIDAPDATSVVSPQDAAQLDGVYDLLVEGGAQTAAAFLRAGLVDRLMLYRAPILLGAGKACLADIGLSSLADAHGRWQHIDSRRLGSDTLDVYEAA
jgi:diaminohydroxyphosphoribosylaminopyrimidine deaminase / 5-amino-6-(5-phosphoribosylamino)uracil reductase